MNPNHFGEFTLMEILNFYNKSESDKQCPNWASINCWKGVEM
jgi:hypothetical protein